MPQLDKLLAHITPRGGLRLRMEPNAPPTLELGSGSEVPLLANPLPSTMVEALTREIVPPAQVPALATSGEAVFERAVGTETFRISVNRGPLGVRLVAEPLRGVGTQPPIAARTAIPPQPPSPPPAPAFMPSTPPAPLRVPPAPPAPEPPPVATHAGAPAAKAQPVYGSHPLAERMLRTLLERKGSDLHLSCFEAPVARIHGDMEELLEFGILGPSQISEIMEALAPPPAWAHFCEVNDADFAYPFEAGGCRLRVNYFMDRVGPGMVCRVIPNELPDPDKLGLAQPIRDLAMLSKGLVLVTGPTGSGKSTTLAAIIDLANKQRNDHILTIEDPIEFVHPKKRCLVNQREVGTHTASFKSGLRAALREDPDIILVGEMRDLETIAIALETAITGHLVFGTLHTSSAIGTIDRIVDQFPADRQQQIRVMLADALKCVVSQVLLKKVGGGRIAALESLFITPAISNLMREGKNFQIPSAMQTGRAYGQRLMSDALVELIQARQVEPQEAYLKCSDREAFMATLKRSGIDWDPRAAQG